MDLPLCVSFWPMPHPHLFTPIVPASLTATSVLWKYASNPCSFFGMPAFRFTELVDLEQYEGPPEILAMRKESTAG